QLGDVPPSRALVRRERRKTLRTRQSFRQLSVSSFVLRSRYSGLFCGAEPITLGAMVPFCRFAILALASSVAFSDTLQLKDNASISERVIQEKTESVAVDVGYTILMVPRSAIVKVVSPKEDEKSDESKAPKGPNTTPPASAQLTQTFYQNPGALRKDSTVRE